STNSGSRLCWKKPCQRKASAGDMGKNLGPGHRGSEVARPQPRVFRNAGQHARPDLFIVVEREDHVRPAGAFQDAVRSTGLAFYGPAGAQQTRKDSLGFGRRPPAHGATAKTPSISGTGSPWSRRSANTRSERTWTRPMASSRDFPYA